MHKLALGAVALLLLAGLAWWALGDHSSKQASNGMAEQESTVKDFVVTAFADGKEAWFSLNEMRVKKGDLVRVKITNLQGSGNFNLDAFGVKLDTPVNQEMFTSFVADRPGQYEYYVNHTQDGGPAQTGQLIVE